MPAELASVTISVTDTGWVAVGQNVFIQGAGTFEVTAIPTLLTLTVKNLKDSTNLLYMSNVAPATNIAAGARVTIGGYQASAGLNLHGNGPPAANPADTAATNFYMDETNDALYYWKVTGSSWVKILGLFFFMACLLCQGAAPTITTNAIERNPLTTSKYFNQTNAEDTVYFPAVVGTNGSAFWVTRNRLLNTQPLVLREKFVKNGSTGITGGEPSVIYDPIDGLFKMWFSAGAFGASKIWYTTSATGVTNWTAPIPVIGHGIGGEANDASRGNVFYENGTNWHFHSDLSGTANLAGDIYLCRATNNSTNFTAVSKVFTNVDGYGYANSRILKTTNGTYYAFLESLKGTSQREISQLWSATNIWGPYKSNTTLWLQSYSGLPDPSGAIVETTSPGSAFQVGDKYFEFTWNYIPSIQPAAITEIFGSFSGDLTNWSRPHYVMPISTNDYIGGVPQTQWSDVCVLQALGKTWMFASYVGAVGEIYSFTYDGSLTNLLIDQTDADSIRGTVYSPNPPAHGEIPVYNVTNRLVEYKPYMDGGYIPAPLSTVTVVSVAANPDLSGTYTQSPSQGAFFVKTGAASLLNTNAYGGNTENGTVWCIIDALNVPKFGGPGFSEANPGYAASYQTNYAGSSGSLTVTLNPAIATIRAWYTNQGPPCFSAPVGSFYVRFGNNATNRTIYINQSGTNRWTSLGTAGKEI